MFTRVFGIQMLPIRGFRFLSLSSTRFLSQSTRNSVIPENNLDPDELGFLSRKEITAREVHDRLQLICPNYAAHADWKQVALKYPAVFYCKSPAIKQILNMLTHDRFVSDRSVFLNNLWVFQFTPSSLKDKIITIKVLAASDFIQNHTDDHVTLPDHFKLCLTPFSERVIFWLMKKYKMNSTKQGRDSLEQLQHFNERVDYLAEKLAVFPFDIIDQLYQHNMHRLILRPQSQMGELMQLYSQIGFQSTDLRKHLWLLTRTTSGLKPRIETLQQHRIRIRPWMLSAPVSEVDRVRQEATIANEYQSVTKFLMNKLNLESDTAKSMVEANPVLESRKKTMHHISEVVDYLMSEGYSAKDMSECPKALTMSLVKLKTRIQELKATNSPNSLSIVCENQFPHPRVVEQSVRADKIERRI